MHYLVTLKYARSLCLQNGAAAFTISLKGGELYI